MVVLRVMHPWINNLEYPLWLFVILVCYKFWQFFYANKIWLCILVLKFINLEVLRFFCVYSVFGPLDRWLNFSDIEPIEEPKEPKKKD